MSDGIAPIVIEVDLDATPRAAYDAFVSGFCDWWPVLTHSLARSQDTRCALEPQAGGRIVETAPDGALHLWGSVTGVEPGRRLRFSWHPGREAESAQWVEVSFETSQRGCRATLVHGGWERLGELGPLLRREYVPGWQRVFSECFAGYVAQRH